MYHLFVTSQEQAWEGSSYTFHRSRFLEYTNQEVSERFSVLTETHIAALLSWPCLFAYEGKHNEARVGKLLAVRERGREIEIEFQIDNAIPAIPYNGLESIASDLDIRRWEMNRTHWAVKEADLLELLRDTGLIPPVTPNENGSESRLPEPAPSNHSASSVGQFVNIILGLRQEGKEAFYRGHSSKTRYKLEPSVLRKDTHGNYLYLDKEEILYRELLVSNSHDFQGDSCTLDKLVRMQHYSLPTRLLDITSNPLIALYFACKSGAAATAAEGREEEGEVIVFAIEPSDIKYFDSDTASCIANLARLPKHEKDAISFSDCDMTAFNAQQSVKRLIHFVMEEKSFFEPRINPSDLRTILCVKSKRSNNRISSQSGAFLLFGHDAVLDEKGTERIGVTRIAISNKASILTELDLLNINESTVFPHIENSAKYVAQKYAFKGTPQGSGLPDPVTN